MVMPPSDSAAVDSSPSAAAAATRPQPPVNDGSLHVMVVGMSVRAACGVRDHAGLLGESLADHGVSCSFRWLARTEPSLRGARAEVRSWAAGLERELDA